MDNQHDSFNNDNDFDKKENEISEEDREHINNQNLEEQDNIPREKEETTEDDISEETEPEMESPSLEQEYGDKEDIQGGYNTIEDKDNTPEEHTEKETQSIHETEKEENEMDDITKNLENLYDLKSKGILSDEEYQKMKNKILFGEDTSKSKPKDRSKSLNILYKIIGILSYLVGLFLVVIFTKAYRLYEIVRTDVPFYTKEFLNERLDFFSSHITEQLSYYDLYFNRILSVFLVIFAVSITLTFIIRLTMKKSSPEKKSNRIVNSLLGFPSLFFISLLSLSMINLCNTSFSNLTLNLALSLVIFVIYLFSYVILFIRILNSSIKPIKTTATLISSFLVISYVILLQALPKAVKLVKGNIISFINIGILGLFAVILAYFVIKKFTWKVLNIKSLLSLLISILIFGGSYALFYFYGFQGVLISSILILSLLLIIFISKIFYVIGEYLSQVLLSIKNIYLRYSILGLISLVIGFISIFFIPM